MSNTPKNAYLKDSQQNREIIQSPLTTFDTKPTPRVQRLLEEQRRLEEQRLRAIQEEERSKEVAQQTRPVSPLPKLQAYSGAHDIYKYARSRMVKEQLVARGIRDPFVLQAMEKLPRHLFVTEALQATAYDDRPLPIAGGQTISQPYVVAYMCQLLMAKPGMKILEIGTGSGYQASVLQEMELNVYSVERIAELYENTKHFLREVLGYHSMNLFFSDGTLGMPSYAPYDRIIVAAGGPTIPKALLEQMNDGGIMLIPVGQERQRQHLIRVIKHGHSYTQEDCGPTTFVDLVGQDGWKHTQKP